MVIYAKQQTNKRNKAKRTTCLNISKHQWTLIKKGNNNKKKIKVHFFLLNMKLSSRHLNVYRCQLTWLQLCRCSDYRLVLVQWQPVSTPFTFMYLTGISLTGWMSSYSLLKERLHCNPSSLSKETITPPYVSHIYEDYIRCSLDPCSWIV